MSSGNTLASRDIQQLQGQGPEPIPTSSDLPPVYTTAGSSQAHVQSQLQLQSSNHPPIYSSNSNFEDGSAAHWSPYDSTVNLAQASHPDLPHSHSHPHPHRHPMGLASTEHHHSHSAFSSSSAEHHPHSHHHPHQHREKEKPTLSIILDNPYITLKGTGPDVEPTTLSGHVVLFLSEATALKELTLQFRGKARIPMPANESLINSATSITYVVCNHDWSFLETPSSSAKRHARTLKAGRHYFPFSLSIGGSLPSSISSPALGGASVAYKLRAVAVRPGLAHNLQSILPVPILRSFTSEALEYQQTLEIENTWPDKLMYSIMLPHKAWAAGDALGAVLKFSPLAKGVRVVSVLSSVVEITKVYARSGPLEDTRVVCSARHEIAREGRAVEVEVAAGMLTGGAAHAATVGVGGSAASRGEGSSSGHTHAHGAQRLGSAFSNLAHIVSDHSNSNSAGSSRRNLVEDGEGHTSSSAGTSVHVEEDGYENNDVVTYIKLRIPYSSTPAHTPTGGHSPASVSGYVTPTGTGTSTPITPGLLPSVASSSSHFPSSSTTVFAGPHFATTSSTASPPPNVLITPSHTLEPITVSHRIRWSIYIRNRDGHISELRCSLPIVVLDGRLRADARDASLMSRRMMARSCNIVPERGDEELWGLGVGLGAGGEGGEGDDADADAQADRELPSYTAHVRDRVANMFLPEAVTMRVRSGFSSPNLPSPAALGEPADPLASTSSSAAAAAGGEEHGSGSASGSERNTRRNSSYANLDSSHTMSMSQLPHVPASGSSTPLDWVNSELLSLNLNDDSLHRFGVDSGVGAGSTSAASGTGGLGDGAITPLTPAGVRTPPPPAPLQYVSSGPGSRSGSRWGSRPGSRASSPERGGDGVHHRRQQSGDFQHPSHSTEQRISRPGSPTFGAASATAHPPGPAALGYVYEPLHTSASGSGSAGQHAHSPSGAHQHQHPDHHAHAHGHGHGHGHGHHGVGGGRLGSFFKATMKPFTALSTHKHRHDESKDSGGSGPNSREGSPTIGGRSHFELDSASASTIPPRNSPFHASQPDLSMSASMAATTRSVGGTVGADNQGQTPPALSTSRSTSNLPAMRLAAAQAQAQQHASPYGQVRNPSTDLNAGTQSQPSLPRGMSLPLNPHALLQRALTEVPDYAVASRGFLGGVPPLTSMRGLPSYEEAVAHAHAHAHARPAGSAITVSELETAGSGPSSQNVSGSESREGPSQSVSPSAACPLSRSEPDIAGRFSRVRFHVTPISPTAQVQGQGEARSSGVEVPQRVEDGDEDAEADDDDYDEGIQMRSSHARGA